jgi:hypothetical protein
MVRRLEEVAPLQPLDAWFSLALSGSSSLAPSAGSVFSSQGKLWVLGGNVTTVPSGSRAVYVSDGAL